jgi:hypothetical protein
MRKSILMIGSLALLLALTGKAQAQNTTTSSQSTSSQSTAQNTSDQWTGVEYPVGHEVVVELTPTTASTGAAPQVKVMHKADGTVITVDPTSFADTTGNLNLYVVDPSGKATMVGVIKAGGTAPQTFNTSMDKFMLVASPDANLSEYTPDTNVAYRSSVPQGLAVIPMSRKGRGPTAARGEKVAGVATPSNSVAMLNVPTLPKNKETEVKVAFPDAAPVPRANIFVTPNYKDTGTSRVKAKFHDLSAVPTTAYLTLWAVSPDGKFFRVGSTQNKGNPNVAEIDSDKLNTNVPFKDFGLFLTVEPTDTATSPTGKVFGTTQQ